MMTTERDRALLEKIETMYKAKGIATKGSLRQEVVLANNKAQYDFDFDGKRTGKESEVLLAAQDVFFANRLALYITAEAEGKEGTGQLFTYIDATAFPAVAGFKPADLNSIWNGRIKCQLGTNVIMESFSSRLFFKKPTELVDRDGSVDLEPTLVFNGKDKNKLSLIIPSFDGIEIASVTDGTLHKVILIADGFLVTGVGK